MKFSKHMIISLALPVCLSKVNPYWHDDAGGQGYCPSDPASKADCGSHWKGNFWDAGSEWGFHARSRPWLLALPASQWLPTQCETYRVKPKGTPQEEDEP